MKVLSVVVVDLAPSTDGDAELLWSNFMPNGVVGVSLYSLRPGGDVAVGSIDRSRVRGVVGCHWWLLHKGSEQAAGEGAAEPWE